MYTQIITEDKESRTQTNVAGIGEGKKEQGLKSSQSCFGVVIFACDLANKACHRGQEMVAQTFNPSTREAEADRSL